ncbi:MULTISPECIES: thioredoxin family protein [Legionella]|uniref:Thioredoxin n=1 Tax=Legionella septentrionalis TaxID=2498109 RepID=A0A3S0XSK2_9GAMM|nr:MULTISPECIES: thioredoxin domain-containing protein [Legionella]MCP0913415.1 thioredoxin domain-containing protein [Legionella sp. 27cVA30]RUQ84942.1 thiol reductase thioredoxin [Legionella septentrionalis]RUQ99592.1 thiol reductase thioredoxin [Legionella septentrionalis]RUR09846.1 thiol reductase thioredoxin [Legionella septentrionalis]RUR13560.1 thiol reductase thioredoxin [Legionella septentrionalis]
MAGSGSVQSVSSAQFEALISENEIVFLDFWAEWCGPCREFAKVYERVASQYENQVVFAKVNIEEEGELAEIFQIRSIPHLVVFKQGIVIYSEPGSMRDSILKELVEQAIQANMDEVRAELNKDTN